MGKISANQKLRTASMYVWGFAWNQNSKKQDNRPNLADVFCRTNLGSSYFKQNHKIFLAPSFFFLSFFSFFWCLDDHLLFLIEKKKATLRFKRQTNISFSFLLWHNSKISKHELLPPGVSPHKTRTQKKQKKKTKPLLRRLPRHSSRQDEQQYLNPRLETLPSILAITSATRFWHSVHRISAERTTCWICSEQNYLT